MLKGKIVPLVLCGGMGMRLWPFASASNPKQFIDLGNGTNMLKNTLARLKKIKTLSTPIILCNIRHEFKVLEQLKQVEDKNYFIIVEPISRGTAPAIISALIILNEKFENPVYLVIPSDHHIGNLINFNKVIIEGVDYALDGYITNFGIAPKYAETGYGYIKKGPLVYKNIEQKHNNPAFFAENFLEKPDLKILESYVNSNEYFWNSGIFMFQYNIILKEFKQFTPETVNFCKLAVTKGLKKHNRFYLEKRSFSKCIKNSVDYAIMEKTNKMVVVPMDVDWKDLGSWKSLMEISKKNKNADGNVLQGNVITYETKNSYINAKSRLVTTVGINEHVIIETSDSVLVVPMSKTQDVKHVVLKENLHESKKTVSSSIKQSYCWGEYKEIFASNMISINLITIKPNSFVDIEKTFKPRVNWLVISGKGFVSNDKHLFYLNKKDVIINIKCIPGYLLYNSHCEDVLKIVEIKGCFLTKESNF